MLAEQLDDRHRGLFLLRSHLGEDRRLVDAASNHDADDHENDAQQERHAPTPLDEGLTGRDDARHECENTGCQQETERHAHLREGAELSALALRSVFDRHQHRAAPLASGGEALQNAQQHQQNRCGGADDGVRRQQTDEGGGCSHENECPHEHGFAADLVAEVPGDEGAEWAEEEAHSD